jgi:hypothetical protein
MLRVFDIARRKERERRSYDPAKLGVDCRTSDHWDARGGVKDDNARVSKTQDRRGV